MLSIRQDSELLEILFFINATSCLRITVSFFWSDGIFTRHYPFAGCPAVVPPDIVGIWGWRTARCAPGQNPVSFKESGGIRWTVKLYCISYPWNPHVGRRRIITASFWKIGISARLVDESLPFERQLELLLIFTSFCMHLKYYPALYPSSIVGE